jgi:hypothetical protein
MLRREGDTVERPTSPRRLGITIAVALGAIAAFAAIGGTGFAGGLAKPSKAQYGPGQYQNPGKVTICHKGKVTIRVSVRALPAHEAHGDFVGTCAAARAAKLKTAKVKAAKAAKAAKQAAKAAKANKPTKGSDDEAEADEDASKSQGNGKAKGKNKG